MRCIIVVGEKNGVAIPESHRPMVQRALTEAHWHLSVLCSSYALSIIDIVGRVWLTEKMFLLQEHLFCALLGRKGLIWKISKFSVFRKEMETQESSNSSNQVHGIAWVEFSCWARQLNGIGREGPNSGQKRATGSGVPGWMGRAGVFSRSCRFPLDSI